MKENMNKHEVVLATEQWHKLDKLLGGLKLTQKQHRIYSDVRWHMAKFNQHQSRIRCAEEIFWAQQRRGVKTVLSRIFQPPFNGCLDVYVKNHLDHVELVRMIVVGAHQDHRRTVEKVDPETGIQYLAKPHPTIKYRLKDSVMFYQISAMELHHFIMHSLIDGGPTKQEKIDFDLKLDFKADARRLGV